MSHHKLTIFLAAQAVMTVLSACLGVCSDAVYTPSVHLLCVQRHHVSVRDEDVVGGLEDKGQRAGGGTEGGRGGDCQTSSDPEAGRSDQAESSGLHETEVIQGEGNVVIAGTNEAATGTTETATAKQTKKSSKVILL